MMDRRSGKFKGWEAGLFGEKRKFFKKGVDANRGYGYLSAPLNEGLQHGAFNESDVGAWRSLVAHLHGVQGVAGSNPVAPT